MKFAFASAIAAIVLAGAAAVAQTTAPTPPTPPVAAAPAAPVPPSSCPAYPPLPAAIAAESIRNQKDLNAGTTSVNAFLESYNRVHQCRVAEITAITNQFEARRLEAKTAQDATLAYRNAWQATTEAVMARNAKGKGK